MIGMPKKQFLLRSAAFTAKVCFDDLLIDRRGGHRIF